MNIEKSKKGMALVTILLLTVLLTIMTVSMVFISTQHLRLMGNVEGYDISLKAAEAGAEYAFAQLNSNPLWGDPNTPDVNKTLSNGSKFYITFKPGNDYYSYNNLMSTTAHNRAGVLQGKVPAYTAEIISIGESPGKIKKILRVVFIRDDRIPANVLAKGKIFCKSGKIAFTGEDANEPGWVYSQWKDPNDDPNDYSIYSDELTPASTVDAKGGIISSRGKIKLNIAKEGDVYVDENTAKKVEGTDIDINKMLKEASSADSTIKTSHSYRVTTFNGIKDNNDIMKSFINIKYGRAKDQLLSLCYPAIKSGSPGGSGDVCYVSKGISSADYTVSGEQESWFSTKTGNGKSWNQISASASGVENYEKFSASQVYDPNGEPAGWEWKSDGVSSRALTTDGMSFSLTEDKISGQSFYCIKGKSHIFDQEIGLVRIGSGGVPWPPETGSGIYDIVKNNTLFAEEGKTMDGFSVNKTVSDDEKVEYSVCLQSDVYADVQTPSEADYALTCNDVQYKAFSIKREYSMDNNLTGEMVLNTSLDMNGHNLYSGGHTSLGLLIENNKNEGGMVVSGGKLNYLYGYEGANLIAVSKDDLYLPTSNESNKYNLKGYLYTDNDLVIEAINDKVNLKTTGSIETAAGGRVITTNCLIERDEPLKNVNNQTSKEELQCEGLPFIEIDNGSTFMIPDRAVKMNYTNASGTLSTEIDLTGYQVSYATDMSGNVSIEKVYKAHTLTCTSPPYETIQTYVELPYNREIITFPSDPNVSYQGEPVSMADINCSGGDPNEVIANIGQLLYDNYRHSEVKLTGQIVTNNERTGNQDNNGDMNIIIDPGQQSKFNSINDIVDISALVNARQENFTIRRMCWEIIR